MAGSYWIDRIGLIVSAGSYRLDRIGWLVSVSVLGLLVETGFYALAGLLLAGWDEWTGWGVGGTDVSRRRNRSTTIVARIGEPPLALEGQRVVGMGGWHQLCQ